MLALFYPWGLILQALAIVHFIRRRPDGALLRGTFNAFPRRKRIRQLEAEVLENPSVGNFEELGDLLLEDKRYARARECFDRAITPRTATVDPFYRRALAAIGLNDWPAAVADLERVEAIDPKYDY